jgi:multicomponent Na+:H+ antiporter subunit C
MSRAQLFSLAAVALIVLGIHAAATRRHLIRKVLALNVAGGGVFLLLVSIAWRNRGPAPDPVPHAMVLTGIVVAVSVTAFALALVRRLHARTGRTSLSEREGLE